MTKQMYYAVFNNTEMFFAKRKYQPSAKATFYNVTVTYHTVKCKHLIHHMRCLAVFATFIQ